MHIIGDGRESVFKLNCPKGRPELRENYGFRARGISRTPALLRNLLGITRVRDINLAESQALELAQEAAVDLYGPNHRFTANDICRLHRLWLGPIYPWAGEYRSVNIGKGGFQFAHAPRIVSLVGELERDALRRYTPSHTMSVLEMARTLAEVHAELILVHPFRDGNGRLARLFMLLMALQADLPALDFSPLAGRGRATYVACIHAAMNRDYTSLNATMARVIERSKRRAASSGR